MIEFLSVVIKSLVRYHLNLNKYYTGEMLCLTYLF